MTGKLLLGAVALLASAATPAAIVVLPTGITNDYIVAGRGNPVTLLSFDVYSATGGTVIFGTYSDPITLGTLAPGETRSFAPNLLFQNIPPTENYRYGYFYYRLNVETAPGIDQFATWSNITLDIGDDILPLPEPSSWALMIAGFGLAGAALRRRARAALAQPLKAGDQP